MIITFIINEGFLWKYRIRLHGKQKLKKFLDQLFACLTNLCGGKINHWYY